MNPSRFFMISFVGGLVMSLVVVSCIDLGQCAPAELSPGRHAITAWDRNTSGPIPPMETGDLDYDPDAKRVTLSYEKEGIPRTVVLRIVDEAKVFASGGTGNSGGAGGNGGGQ